MKRLWLLFSALLFAGFLASGCGTMGTQTCIGPNCTRAEAYSSISEMRAQTTILVDANKIPAAKAEEVRTQLRTAQTAVDASTGLGGDDQLSKARSAISVARTILLAYGATLK